MGYLILTIYIILAVIIGSVLIVLMSFDYSSYNKTGNICFVEYTPFCFSSDGDDDKDGVVLWGSIFWPITIAILLIIGIFLIYKMVITLISCKVMDLLQRIRINVKKL